jgi:hypothetical protein
MPPPHRDTQMPRFCSAQRLATQEFRTKLV